MYDLARAGEIVEVPSRIVEVTGLEIVGWRSQDFPKLELAIACGAGTYIRSIARDLGELLGTGGTLAGLVRTESHGFSLTDSTTLEMLEAQVKAQIFQPLDPAQALSHLSKLNLTQDEAKRWSQGQRLANVEGNSSAENPSPLIDTPLRVCDHTATFLGIGRWNQTADGPTLAPWIVFGK
jgi:tRNA pseudouridine55 synthase